MFDFLFAFLLINFGGCLTLKHSVTDSMKDDPATDILFREVENLKEALEQLPKMKEDIFTLMMENLQLRKRVNTLETTNAEITQTLQELITENHNLRDSNMKMSSTNKNHQKKDISASMRTAFTALYRNTNRTLAVGQTVIFEAIRTNIGDEYSKTTGVFTATSPGVYVFFVNTICHPTENIHAEIVKDGNNIARLYCYDDIAYTNGSNMVIVQLAVGDSVWVRANGINDDTKPALGTDSSFSGFLLYSN